MARTVGPAAGLGGLVLLAVFLTTNCRADAGAAAPPSGTVAQCCADRRPAAALGSASAVSGAPYFGWVLDTTPYPPRWRCGTWSAGVGWLHILSDVTIWLAYSAIPLALVWFARNRSDLQLYGLPLLFGAFILLCGLTHLMEAVIFWWPAYGLAGLLKLTTAVVSVATAVALVRALPIALTFRSPEELEEEVRQRTREVELARQEAIQIIESSPTGMVMVDQSGDIQMVNAVTEGLFGASREELIGRSVDTLLPERYRATHPEQRRGYYASPEARSMGAGRELYALRANGQEFPIEIGLQPVRTSKGLMVLSAIVDISERSAMQSMLAAKGQELECANSALRRSNEELESFAFVASHDLQEPLRKISSYCQLIKEEKGDQLDEEATGYLDVAINGAERLRVLVRDLLSFSRIATRGEPLCPTNANACLEAALDNLAMAIAESGAVIHKADLPKLSADKSQLTLLFQNLVGNALKYRGESTPEVSISCAPAGETLIVSVADNGIGIPEEFSTKVFGIFQRLHSRSKYGGTGIGLALCKRIVERFGGSIWVEPREGGGSVFCFSVNAAADEADGAPARPYSRSPGG